ncbi:MAG: hypothetical protein AAF206_16910 [Bacteroidota bacterium]
MFLVLGCMGILEALAVLVLFVDLRSLDVSIIGLPVVFVIFFAPIGILLLMPSARAFLRYQREGKSEAEHLEQKLEEIGRTTEAGS